MRRTLIGMYALLTVVCFITGIVMADTVSNIKLKPDINSPLYNNAKDFVGISL